MPFAESKLKRKEWLMYCCFIPHKPYTLFFISKTFISNARLKLVKNQANAKQHTEAELLLSENYSHSLHTLSFKNNGTYSKKY